MGINTTKSVIRTALHDKRQTDVFKGFVFHRFPHVTSALTDRAKFGIVVSQFHRFRMHTLMLHDIGFAAGCSKFYFRRQSKETAA